MKRTVYVVDDQSAVLETVVLALRSLGRDWQVLGFSTPFGALEAVKDHPPDAVLSDQAMPGMQGSELLEEVRQISPGTIRLIMSGCVSLDKLALITSAHQYVAKPFDALQLRDLIKRGFDAQQRLTNQGLQKIATSIRSIPSLPQAHHALLAELEDGNSPGTSIARHIAADPGVTAKVLHLANSALFGRGSPVTGLTEAVACLGTDLIASIVLAQSIFRHYESLKHQEIDLDRIWSHCWETATLAQRLCREKKLPGKTGEAAFLAGLLHETGRFVLLDNFPEEYQAACNQARSTTTSLAPALRETFQAATPQVSAYVLDLWGMPHATVNAISHLETPEDDSAREFGLTTALYAAHHIASQKSPPDSFPPEDWEMEYLEAMGCASDLAAWSDYPLQSEDAGVV